MITNIQNISEHVFFYHLKGLKHHSKNFIESLAVGNILRQVDFHFIVIKSYLFIIIILENLLNKKILYFDMSSF